VNSAAQRDTITIPGLSAANYSAFDIDSPPIQWSIEPNVTDRPYVIGEVVTIRAVASDQSNLSSVCTTQVSVMIATSLGAPDDLVFSGSSLRPASFSINLDVKGSSPKGDGSRRYTIDETGLGRDLGHFVVAGPTFLCLVPYGIGLTLLTDYF
jgi:hypothetical protein